MENVVHADVIVKIPQKQFVQPAQFLKPAESMRSQSKSHMEFGAASPKMIALRLSNDVTLLPWLP
jgi:hypothetical protein